MSYLLSLDASSTTVGYSIWNKDTRELVEMNFYNMKSPIILEKADEFERLIIQLKEKYPQLDEMIIEDAMMAMFGGMSSAHTTTLLNQVNILYRDICKLKGLKVNTITVIESRKKAFPMVKLRPKKIAGGMSHKEQIFEVVVKVLGAEMFPTKEMKSGKRKGETVFVDEAKDMADSYVVGLGFLNKTQNETKKL